MTSEYPDMLVDLRKIASSPYYQRPPLVGAFEVRPGTASDVPAIPAFVKDEFEGWGTDWDAAAEAALLRKPSSCFVAYQQSRPVGFAVYDVGYRGYLGPMGVREDLRGKGVGAALLLLALEAMRESGYLYVVIGSVWPIGFYEKVCGARVIDGSAEAPAI